METVGGYLKKARESKNISIGELSQLTKISALYLKYIENDEFEICYQPQVDTDAR